MSSTAKVSGNKRSILVTGGTGYIGTHTVLSLIEEGYDVTVVDNLANSSSEGLRRVRELTNCEQSRIRFVQVDLCDKEKLRGVFQNSSQFSACIHFAGLKAVGESVHKPLQYYENNLLGTLNLLNLMDEYGCHAIVFSSSATVYGAAQVPITEDTPTGQGITNAYGRTKFMIEEILQDFKVSKDVAKGASAENPWHVVVLRYFNPVGAHPSGRIGEDPSGIPNNLMPYIQQVAVGKREKLTVFGNDYPTKDGTGVRDYIHVMDLAEGHVSALQYIQNAEPAKNTYSVFNLGSGQGYSVLDMVRGMQEASGREIQYEFAPRRAGDIAECYADPSKATKELHWTAKRSLQDCCRDSWNWISHNPDGYRGEEAK